VVHHEWFILDGEAIKGNLIRLAPDPNPAPGQL
jgi:hypothetical protein